VEDVMPIATGLEREEIEAELQVPRMAALPALHFLLRGYLFVKSIKILLDLVRFSVQGKKRFDMDAPVGPFGTKVGDFGLVPSSTFHLAREQLGLLN
jgi:hypothetical protein